MKKFTLLLCLCFVALLLSQKVMADAVLSNNGATLTITTNAAGQISGFVSSFTSDQKSAVTTIVLDGVFNSDDLNSISTNSGFNSVTLTVSVSGTTLTVTSSTAGLLNTFMQSVGSEGHVSSDYLAKMQGCTKIVLSGTFSSGNLSDLSSIQASGSYFNATEVDMTDAVFYTDNSNNNTNNYKLFSGSTTDQGASLFAKAIFNATLYQSTSVKSWQNINNPGEGNADVLNVYPDPANLGQRVAIPSGSYKYEQLTVTASGWSNPKVGADNISGYTQVDWNETQTYDPSHPFSLGNSYLNQNYNKVKLYRYYKIQVTRDGDGKITSRSWVLATSSDWSAATANSDDDMLAFTAGQGDAAEATIDNLNDHAWFEEGTCIRFAIYYDKLFNRTWSGNVTDDSQSDVIQVDFDFNYRYNHYSDFDNITETTWVMMPTYTYHEYQVTDYTWGNENANISFTEGEERYISYHVNAFGSLGNPTAEGQLSVVSTSGSSDIKVYNGETWVDNNSSLQVYDYSAAKFDYWKDYIETAHLPSFIDPANCPSSVLNNCTNLTTLYKGDYFAQRTDNTTDGVTTVTVEATAPNLFNLLLNTRSSQRYADGTLFKFTSSCVLSAEDLVVLTDDQNIKYYVDLYDIPTGEGSTIETVITDAINTIRTSNDKQFKGLLLPNNPINIGTLLIQDTEQNNNAEATCKEFIAYKNGSTTVMHIYKKKDSDNRTFEQRLSTLNEMMTAHDIASATSSYLVTTNKVEKIENVSSLLQTDPATKTIIEVINNELVKEPTTASIYATLVGDEGGQFAQVVENTSLYKTPNVSLIQLNGPVAGSDITAVNAFSANNGPSNLDLKNVSASTPITQDMLNSLENTALEFIVLPGGMDVKDVVDPDYSDLTNLKAVISSTSSDLVAYVKVAGSLAKARSLATGNDGNPNNNQYYPTKQGLSTITLAGNLYAQDIATKSQTTDALYLENKTITSIDLTDAVFYRPSVTEYINGEWVTHDVADSQVMNFHDAGYNEVVENNNNLPKLQSVNLPYNPRMTTIARECFKDIKSLTDVCIPYYYTHILGQSFLDSGVNHITTTDENGALIDNGNYTYTLSANIQQLGTKGETLRTFPQNVKVKEVYSLATKVPVCYMNVFPDNMLNGFGGLKQDMVYCREKYCNPNDGFDNEMIGVLRFPSLESFNNATDKETIDGENDPYGTDAYQKMVKKYTDPYREYTKKDQTGAVDANGEPLVWPTRTEMNQAKASADEGGIWTDFTYEHNGQNNEEITASWKAVSDRTDHYDFDDYIGWHQIVLTQATYVDKNEIVENDTIKRYYEDAGWFTFCIPYDLTYSQVVKMLGIPKSAGMVENYYDGKKVENNDSLPDIRQLLSVTRTAGTGNQDNSIVFRLTPSLQNRNNKSAQYLYFTETDDNKSEFKYVYANQQFDENGQPKFDNSNAPVLNNDADPVCLVGGRPYYIKAYKRQGESIKSRNLGKFIMTRYADEFKQSASCVHGGDDFCEQLKTYTYSTETKSVETTVTGSEDGGVTMRFAKPFEKHKVQAVNGAEGGGLLTFIEGNEEYRYYYTMVGQFWDQDLPEYCLYMSGQNWYRYFDTSLNFKWSAYKCVIMATPELTSSKIKEEDKNELDKLMPLADVQAKVGGGFRDIKHCYFPMNQPGTVDAIPAPLQLWFIGRNDHLFNNYGLAGPKQNNLTRIIFTLDGEEEIVECGENATAVKTIDMLDGVPQMNSSSKVYSLSGLYMGNSVEGLSKGVYIVGGRKIVIE